MNERLLGFALLLAGCSAGSDGRVELSMAGSDAMTARSSSDAATSFVGELYLNVVEINARFDASEAPDDAACGYGEGFDDASEHEDSDDEDDDEDDDDDMDDDDMDHEDMDDDDMDDGDDSEWVMLSDDAVAVSLTGPLSSHEDPIAIANLPPGAVTELRFVLDDEQQATWVQPTGEQVPVTVPSGSSSGLKLKGCMPVQTGYATVIDVTVDIDEALHETGNGEVKLHPTLSVVAELVADPD